MNKEFQDQFDRERWEETVAKARLEVPEQTKVYDIGFSRNLDVLGYDRLKKLFPVSWIADMPNGLSSIDVLGLGEIWFLKHGLKVDIGEPESMKVLLGRSFKAAMEQLAARKANNG